MPAERLARVRLIITGRVQGVFFRASAADQARLLGIHGFARNLADGSVEIVAEGARTKLQVLCAWAQRGPADAQVDDARVEWREFTGEFRKFDVR